MSRHTATTPKFNICLGVDRPLAYVFAQVFLNQPPKDADDDSAQDFNPFSNYSLATQGINKAIADIEQYICKNGEPNFKVPATIMPELQKEVDMLLADPNVDLNIGRNHGRVG